MEMRDRPRGNTLEVQRKEAIIRKETGTKELNGRCFVLGHVLRPDRSTICTVAVSAVCHLGNEDLSRTLLVGLLSH